MLAIMNKPIEPTEREMHAIGREIYLKTAETVNQQTIKRIAAACRQLRRSERGMTALRNLETFLGEGGAGLDGTNQRAVQAIIDAAFTCPWNLPGGYKLVDSGN